MRAPWASGERPYARVSNATHSTWWGPSGTRRRPAAPRELGAEPGRRWVAHECVPRPQVRFPAPSMGSGDRGRRGRSPKVRALRWRPTDLTLTNRLTRKPLRHQQIGNPARSGALVLLSEPLIVRPAVVPTCRCECAVVPMSGYTSRRHAGHWKQCRGGQGIQHVLDRFKGQFLLVTGGYISQPGMFPSNKATPTGCFASQTAATEHGPRRNVGGRVSGSTAGQTTVAVRGSPSWCSWMY